MIAKNSIGVGQEVARRTRSLLLGQQQAIFQRTDRMFAGLMLLQWLAAFAAAIWVSPRSWIGATSQVHLHVWLAVGLGGAIASLPIYLAWRRVGADVEMAENGKIGVEIATAEHFDLVLMDMQMPVMDGYQATRILHDRQPSLPIVALTAHAMKGDEEKCRESGCCDYLTKPINHEQLIRTLANALHEARGNRSTPFAGTSIE